MFRQSRQIIQYTIRFLLIFVLLNTVTACVTTTIGGFSDKASPEKAAENYTKLGLAYLRQGSTQRAREKLKKALDIRPEYAPAHDAMGLLWQSVGELEYAQESFLSAIKYDSKLNEARHHFAILLMQEKQYAKADKQLLLISEDRFYTNRPQVFKDLAISAYQQQENQKAVMYYRRALRLTLYDATVLVNLATLLFEMEDYTEANKYFLRLDKMVASGASKHTAHSLWLGVRLANALKQPSIEIERGRELEMKFPASPEYAQYKKSTLSSESNL